MNNPLNDLVRLAASSQDNQDKLELLSLKLDLLVKEAALRDCMVLILLFKMGVSQEKINEAYFNLRSDVKENYKPMVDKAIEQTEKLYKIN